MHVGERFVRCRQRKSEVNVMIQAVGLANEQQLVHKAAGGNTEAFGELVRAYQHRLFSTVVHIVRCRAEAEDIVQDAMVQAFVKLSTFRGGSSFYTWLYRITVNLALSRGRRHRARQSLEQAQDVMLDEPADPQGSPSDLLMRQERASEIKRALASLSDEQRSILLLRGVEGFDYETIGRILNLNPGTVRSRLHRARAELRAKLAEPASCPA